MAKERGERTFCFDVTAVTQTRRRQTVAAAAAVNGRRRGNRDILLKTFFSCSVTVSFASQPVLLYVYNIIYIYIYV